MDWLQPLLTSISILLATLGWMRGQYLTRQLSRRKHTLDIMLAQDSNLQLAGYLDRADAQAAAKDTLDPRAPTKDIRSALNFYEFLSAATRDKTLDAKLIKRTMRFRMLRFYHNAKPVIDAVRTRYANPRIMEDFEWFATHELDYERWKKTLASQADVISLGLEKPSAP